MKPKAKASKAKKGEEEKAAEVEEDEVKPPTKRKAKKGEDKKAPEVEEDEEKPKPKKKAKKGEEKKAPEVEEDEEKPKPKKKAKKGDANKAPEVEEDEEKPKPKKTAKKGEEKKAPEVEEDEEKPKPKKKAKKGDENKADEDEAVKPPPKRKAKKDQAAEVEEDEVKPPPKRKAKKGEEKKAPEVEEDEENPKPKRKAKAKKPEVVSNVNGPYGEEEEESEAYPSSSKAKNPRAEKGSEVAKAKRSLKTEKDSSRKGELAPDGQVTRARTPRVDGDLVITSFGDENVEGTKENTNSDKKDDKKVDTPAESKGNGAKAEETQPQLTVHPQESPSRDDGSLLESQWFLVSRKHHVDFCWTSQKFKRYYFWMTFLFECIQHYKMNDLIASKEHAFFFKHIAFPSFTLSIWGLAIPSNRHLSWSRSSIRLRARQKRLMRYRRAPQSRALALKLFVGTAI